MSRIDDLEYDWFTNSYGQGWETWRELASAWTLQHDYGIEHIRNALCRFLEDYLVPNFLTEPVEFFHRPKGDYSKFLDELDLSEVYRTRQNNEINRFINWVIDTYYSEPDDNGTPVALFSNPVGILKNTHARLETVYNALPYCYIQRFKEILCPKSRGNFSDWNWATSLTDIETTGGRFLRDWMLVDESLIDPSDPDCVWKSVVLKGKRSYRLNGVLQSYSKGEKLHFIWSPVRSVALLTKLTLPLRTFQVRMLDSGEADTWRYEKGQWIENKQHNFVLGDIKRPWQKGVFHRIKTPDIGDIMTGLYINTNKTADKNKDELTRGYVIPWQHDDMLYWLEKLRNWQEKYNPINTPTPIHKVHRKCFGAVKTKVQREELGDICFLFRNASSSNDNERQFPVTNSFVYSLWYQLLKYFEEKLFSEGSRLNDGRKIEFVDPKVNRVPLFPLHSLRVSLITCYALEGEIPAPVLSKLLVGHSRLIMTMHYTKVTPTVMAKKMKLAEDKIVEASEQSLQTFLLDKSMQEIELNTAYKELSSIKSMLKVRNPAGWQEKGIGICLAGGNTSRGEDSTCISGCWNGGDKLKKANMNQADLHESVPHGLENCIRCRWFITDIRYIHALTAHFNNLSYQATEAADLATELENRKEQLLDDKYFCEVQNQKFKHQVELDSIERRVEKQKVEADEYCKDLISCFQIIRNLLKLEESRGDTDDKQKIIALGSAEDITPHFSFFETESELMQLVQVCNDAEIYPDLKDDLRFTPAIHHRSTYLNKALMKTGYMPFFMQMSDEMQLIAGNAMINAMSEYFETKDYQTTIKKVVEYLESTSIAANPLLIEHGIKAIQNVTNSPVLKITDLYSNKKAKGVAHEC